VQSGLDNTTARRAISPLVGVLALVLITIALGSVIAAVGVGALSVSSTAPTAAFDLAVDGNRSTVTIDHVAGDPVDVEAVSMTIAVDGTELAAQPPVPFVGSEGFYETPQGPFNDEADSEWKTGTTAGLTVAETNTPTIDSGDTVVVTLAVDGERIVRLETIAE